MIITIDGPTASGKSTLAKSLAKELKIYHLNTGFLYRALAYILINDFNYDDQKIKNPDKQDLINILDPKKFAYVFNDGNTIILFRKKNITSFLKNSEIDYYSSIVSQNQNVRSGLMSLQRDIGKKNNVVIEGRDCGSVVFPDADLKIFLTADLQVRAKRWQEYMYAKGNIYSLEQAIQIVSERDERDKNRELSPLVIPKNAIIIDDSNLTENEVLQKVMDLYKKLSS